MNGQNSRTPARTQIRTRIVGAIAALGAAAVIAALAPFGRPLIPTPALAYTAPAPGADWPPIIDMHAHWQPGVTVATVLRSMEASNVQKAVIMPNGGHRFDAALELQQQHPRQFLAFIGFQNGGWIRQQPGFLGPVEEALRTRQFKGLGEVLLRHYAIPERQAPDVSISANAPSTLRLLELAARYQVPVILHMEAETDPVSTVRQLTMALDEMRTRGLEPVVIWAHAGGPGPGATPQLVDSLLARYPNLYVDISSRSHVYRRATPIIDRQGVLLPEWKALLIRYQDRVVVGSDTPFPDLWTRAIYIDVIRGQRDILRQLPNEVAEKIGYKNAQMLLKLE